MQQVELLTKDSMSSPTPSDGTWRFLVDENVTRLLAPRLQDEHGMQRELAQDTHGRVTPGANLPGVGGG